MWRSRRSRRMSCTTTASRTTGRRTRAKRHSYWPSCRPSQAPRLAPPSGIAGHLPINGEDCASGVHMFSAPLVERGAVSPRLRHPLTGTRSGDPRFDGPALPVDEALVAQQVTARVVLRIGRRHALELLALHVVPLLAQVGHDRDQLLP